MLYPGGSGPPFLRALTLMTGNVAADSNEQLPETASLQQEECPYHAGVAAGEPCVAKLFVFMGPRLKSCLFFSLFLAPVAAINYAEFSIFLLTGVNFVCCFCSCSAMSLETDVNL